MTSTIKKNCFRSLLTLVCMALFFSVSSALAPNPVQWYAPDQAPVVTIIEKKESSITFSLEKITGVAYTVEYTRMENNQSSGPYTILGSLVTFNNLPSGTYSFVFTAISNSGSEYVIVDDIMM
jgi:hypothetical protein